MPKLDVLVAGSDWQPRALLRAQLLEEGWEVMAVEGWAAAEAVLLAEGLPCVLVLILDAGTASPPVLDRIKALVPAGRIVVLSAPSIMTRDALEEHGFSQILLRPFSIRDVVERVRALAAGGQERAESL